MAKQFRFHCAFLFFDDNNLYFDVYSDDIGHAYIKAVARVVKANRDLSDCDFFSINFIE